MQNFKSISLIILAAALLSACGGTKMLKEPVPMEIDGSLAVSGNDQVEVVLDWVTVRDGPGTWAKNADWDEYQLRVTNHGSDAITLTDVQVFDSLGYAAEPMDRRKDLVKGSKQTVKRYDKVADLKVKAGANAGLMAAGGVAIFAAGSAAAYTAAYAAVMTGGTAAGGAVMLASGAVLAAPALVGVGIARAVNNGKVDKEIQARSVALPLVVEPGETADLTLFFPLAPSPEKIRVAYEANGMQSEFDLTTADELFGLHIDPEGENMQILFAQRAGE